MVYTYVVQTVYVCTQDPCKSDVNAFLVGKPPAHVDVYKQYTLQGGEKLETFSHEPPAPARYYYVSSKMFK